MGIAACLGLAACGSGGGSSGGTNPDGSTTIDFGDVSPNSTLTPFYVAVRQGFFQRAGLNVAVQRFQGGGATSVAALATGSVQIASGGPTNFIGSMAKKVIDGKLFGQTGDRNYDLLVSRNITDIHQLKGAILGVSGINSADYVFLRATLAQYGITEKDVTYVTAGTIAERLTALSTGKIQATADASAYRATELTVGNVLLKSEDNPLKVPTVVFWTNSDYLKSHADVLKRFLGALAQAAAWAKQPANENATVAACEQGSGSTAEQCHQQIEFAKDPARASAYTWSSTFAVNAQGIQEGINATALSVPEAKGLTLADVVDSSIAGTHP